MYESGWRKRANGYPFLFVTEASIDPAEDYVTNFHAPNFRTVIPRPVLMNGFRETLLASYEPSAYFARVLRSLEY